MIKDKLFNAVRSILEIFKSKKIKATFHFGDKEINKFMAAFDLCPPHKRFMTSSVEVSLTTTTPVDREYWVKLIEKSRVDDIPEIVAIEHGGNLYVHPETKVLSDGQREIFIKETTDVTE